ncbi:hypothetical protein IF1G_08208 [Cordyceps javanica]|uniref:Uncharacterized protein n=1 Tax=Cordyceps javanica TaxID=43265 RepID=A0A545UTZ6_9HYPO|nr:hypothetical protein IF1G_08208 [Cordyceps javanica]
MYIIGSHGFSLAAYESFLTARAQAKYLVTEEYRRSEFISLSYRLLILLYRLLLAGGMYVTWHRA